MLRKCCFLSFSFCIRAFVFTSYYLEGPSTAPAKIKMKSSWIHDDSTSIEHTDWNETSLSTVICFFFTGLRAESRVWAEIANKFTHKTIKKLCMCCVTFFGVDRIVFCHSYCFIWNFALHRHMYISIKQCTAITLIWISLLFVSHYGFAWK